MQFAVRASQLESAARNVRIDSRNSATPGVASLLDPFELGSLSRSETAAAEAAGSKTGASTLSTSELLVEKPVDSPHAGAAQAGAKELQQMSAFRAHRAAPGFSHQLHRVAAEMRPYAAKISSAKRTR